MSNLHNFIKSYISILNPNWKLTKQIKQKCIKYKIRYKQITKTPLKTQIKTKYKTNDKQINNSCC
jgi:hypothetical protein